MHSRGRDSKVNAKVRLFEIDPAVHVDDPIVGRLVTFPFSQDIEYIAISALHGDRTITESVTISHRKVKVPLNLAQAIRYTRSAFHPSSASSKWLDTRDAASRSSSNSTTHSDSSTYLGAPPKSPRLSSGSLWIKHAIDGVRSVLPNKELNSLGGKKSSTKMRLWVDYLCLNGLNPAEQSTQRTDLIRVHQQAKAVVGWLGMKNEDGSTDMAIDTIEYVDDAMPRNWLSAEHQQKHPEDYAPQHEWLKKLARFWAPDIPFVPPKPYGGLDDFERTKTQQTVARVTGRWISVAEFLVCEYFTRSWVLEELAFAKSPVFLAGDRILSWENLLRLTRLIEELRDTESNVFPAELRPMVHDFPLGIVWTLLQEFEKRQKEDNNQQFEDTTCAHTSFKPLPRIDGTTFMVKQA